MFSSSRKYTQKDVLITYFSSKLYKQDGIQLDHEQLNLWCSIIIQSYFSLKSDNEMYIGFCYQTILDGYYSDGYSAPGSSDGYSAPGSTTLLLLALTRGLEELSKNNVLGRNHQPRRITNEDSEQVGNDFNFARLISCVFKKKENSSDLDQKQPVYQLKMLNASEDNDDKFLGATSRSITIKTSFPWAAFLVVTGICFILFTVNEAFIAEGNASKVIRTILGKLAQAAPSLIAIAVFLLKFIIPGDWDILRDRIHTQSLRELKESISSKGAGKKTRAIKLLASIPNPGYVFSGKNSCAFVHGGSGWFEIDEAITTDDLRNAGYKFGVNYYGQPIVADVKTQVRCVEFPNDEKNNVHISGLHEWQPKYMFELPTRNLRVAGTNSSSPFSETVADCV